MPDLTEEEIEEQRKIAEEHEQSILQKHTDNEGCTCGYWQCSGCTS